MIKRAGWALLLGILLTAGCQNLPFAAPPSRAGVTHIVICWQKHPGDMAERKILVGAADSLRLIPGVVSVTVGNVMPSSRPVVDSSWDIAYVMTFADAQALAAYATHPIHLKLKQDVLDPNVARIRIYDLKTD
jgi:hypothetical protein